MSNGNEKTVLMRRSLEWDGFLQELIDEIEENGFILKITKPQIERLILHHKSIMDIKNDIIKGFKGIESIRPEINMWMKGESNG